MIDAVRRFNVKSNHFIHTIHLLFQSLAQTIWHTSRPSYSKNTKLIIQYPKGKSIRPVSLLQSYLHQGSQPYITVIILKRNIRLRHDALVQDGRNRCRNSETYIEFDPLSFSCNIAYHIR